MYLCIYDSENLKITIIPTQLVQSNEFVMKFIDKEINEELNQLTISYSTKVDTIVINFKDIQIVKEIGNGT